MAERAAQLVDGVLGDLPVRQWVLTLPHRLRYALAYDQRLCRAVLAVFVRAVLGFERRRAAAQGLAGHGGAVTAIQRCGSALNTNVHFHTLVAEGVFAMRPDGGPRFVPAVRPPTDLEVARLLAAVRRRLVRLARRHGIVLDPDGNDDTPRTDPLALEAPVLAEFQGASVLGRIATGPRAIRFAPTELLEKLAAMIPRPRANLLIYHGAFAPRGCLRAARAMERGEESPVPGPGGAAGAPLPGLPVPAVDAGGGPVAPLSAPADHGRPSAPRAPPSAA